MTQAELYLLDLLVRLCAHVGLEVEADHPAAGYVGEAQSVVAHFRGQLAMTAIGRELLAAEQARKDRAAPGTASGMVKRSRGGTA